MAYPVTYPEWPDMNDLLARLHEYARLKAEYGSDTGSVNTIIQSVRETLQQALSEMAGLTEDAALADREPDDYAAILKLRPEGRRILWNHFDSQRYQDRLAGALYGRLAGCTLGAPVEFWPVQDMESWAAWIGDDFPPRDYWSAVRSPDLKRYQVSPCHAYSRSGMDGVPVDDDITYTILGLLIAEEHGLSFKRDDVGSAWLKYLPYACTAEDIALQNLKAGIPAIQAAEPGNPYVQWIGADIRSDPWGYLSPGLPETAARMAWTDAWISHRRNGIYGAMYFSAVIAAAFAVDDPADALRIGLQEIPADCLLAGDIRWALAEGKQIHGYRDARQAVADRFAGMSGVHTNLNACLTIFGLMTGGDDFTRCIGETVAMGYDNDCTAATAGSIFGAARGVQAIPDHWYRPFANKVLTYLHGHQDLAIDDILTRFARLAASRFDR